MNMKMSLLSLFQFCVLTLCCNLFIVFMYFVYYTQLLTTKITHNIHREYDYVIVGAGTSGSLIAHRIATETKATFVVIEAGGSSHPWFEIPLVGPMLHGSVYDWQFETVPQENACLSMKDKKCRLPQGKIVGGSSKLNNMVHVRGNISHYSNWFHGRQSHDYIRSQFDFIENNILQLDEILYQSELGTAILDAAKELGYETLNQDFKLGFRNSKLSQNNGKRWSTSDNLDMSNIVINALVERVILEDNIAEGVSILISDKRYNVFAKKAVILCAGTYNTPKILQLSGIGPANLLNSLNIDLKMNLPVGFNLQDHVTTGLDLILFNKSLSVSAINMLNIFNVYNYFIHGKGPLTTPGCEAIGFLSTKRSKIPDLQFMVMPVGISSDRGSHLRKALGLKEDVWQKYFVKTFDKHSASILPIVLHPKSKGEVFINSKDPRLPPLINPRYLSNKDDVRVLIDGLKLVAKFVKTNAMKEIGAYLNPDSFPGCEIFEIFSDEYWECYVRHLTLTSYHPVGTCSMGLSPSNSVVDTSFKVFGIDRLYVADASVLPTLPSGNINAAVAMMASIFFDTNIKFSKDFLSKKFVCSKYDFLFEYLYSICRS